MAAETSPGDSLKGKILIAMPAMADPRFHKGVILMLEHGPDGAVGVLVNKPLDAVSFADLMDQLDITATHDLTDYRVHFGGPVEIGRGAVLHSLDKMLNHSARLGPIGVTNSMEMLNLIAQGEGPEHSMFCLGYAGWSAGQLDQEIKDNAWLHAPINEDLLFHIDLDKRWDAAMALAGIDPDFLVTTAGRA